ncbi:hypothetical protein [Methylobacterium sp. ARG-1]|uniref:hypothetical protein n=1 Tax=Methylobacterium sp. ARG-1 TaxID=1692501 RepID=UPI0006826880|nr:hypothetical protein [Methylobacterium sp. ARG-1]KNY21078.1 hypothetical protein AKJ13_18940 [Methylobacterium sp. ARG-1]
MLPNMETAAAPLDFDLFRKLLARSRSVLHGGGADPERDLARKKAEELAADARLSFEAVVDLAEGRSRQKEPEQQPRQKANGWFSDFMSDIFKERECASRHPFSEHAMEWALREALVDYDITGLGLFSEAVPDAAMTLIRTAIPWPRTLRAAVDEIATWDRLNSERDKIAKGYQLGDAALLRRLMLRDHVLQDGVASVGDAVARAWWLLNRGKNECISESEVRDGQKTVLADLERMAERVRALTLENRALEEKLATAINKPIRRTNGAKRTAVEAVLREPGADSLSLREIAERAGVSPETVRAVRGARN